MPIAASSPSKDLIQKISKVTDEAFMPAANFLVAALANIEKLEVTQKLSGLGIKTIHTNPLTLLDDLAQKYFGLDDETREYLAAKIAGEFPIVSFKAMMYILSEPPKKHKK